jgi:hypothetical protein
MPAQLLTTLFPRPEVERTIDLTGCCAARGAMPKKPTNMMKKILIPGDYQRLSKRDLIEKFLSEWLTSKQLSSEGEWFRAMLETFYDEITVQQSLHFPMQNNFWPAQKKGYTHSLRMVPPKPTRTKIEIEEVEGGLGDNAKLISLTAAKSIEPEDAISLMGPPANDYEGGI